MIYTVRHVTRYLYPEPVRESVMEVRKHPMTCPVQRCVNFSLTVQPEVRLFRYNDHLGNSVFHFDIPWAHEQLLVTAEAVMEVKPTAERSTLNYRGSWDELDKILEERDCFDMLLDSKFVVASPSLEKLAAEVNAKRRITPLELALQLTRSIHSSFVYDRTITKVDSPLDVALESRRGVCQDFAHILLGLLRPLGLPCRYVSGYLFRRSESTPNPVKPLVGSPGPGLGAVRQVQRTRKPNTEIITKAAVEQAKAIQTREHEQQEPLEPLHHGPEERSSHAWVEVLLPTGVPGEAEWVGFDPTLGCLADDRHILTCVGRDYADVPPTRGLYRGGVTGELSYAVQVHLPEEPVEEDTFRTLS